MANLGFLNFLSGATQGYAGSQEKEQQIQADQRQQYMQMLWQQQQALQQHNWEMQQAQQDFTNQKALELQKEQFETSQNDSRKQNGQPQAHHTFAEFYNIVSQLPRDQQRMFVRNFNGEYGTNYPMPGEVRNGVHIGFYDATPYDVINKVVDGSSGFAPTPAILPSGGQAPQSILYEGPGYGRVPPTNVATPAGTGIPALDPRLSISPIGYTSLTGPWSHYAGYVGPGDEEEFPDYSQLSHNELIHGGY